MLLKLTCAEIKAVEALCGGSYSVNRLADRLGVSQSAASKTLRALDEKALAASEKRGTEKTAGLSLASHSQAFKKLFESRPKAQIETWLSGCALDVLVVMASSGEPLPPKSLEGECGCNKASVFRVLKTLRAAGVVEKTAGGYRITDLLVRQFADAFADNAQLIMQKQLRGYKASVRVGKHVVVRSEAGRTPDFFSLTGLKALQKAGLQVFLTSYGDYYFNLDGIKRTLSVEENFVHALVLAGLRQHAADKTALAIFLKTTPNLDYRKLRRLALQYRVQAPLQELRAAVGYYEKLRDYE